jgi:hypothetical protein
MAAFARRGSPRKVKTPGVLLPDALFARSLPGQDEKEKATQSEKIRVQTSWGALDISMKLGAYEGPTFSRGFGRLPQE